jgi:hypothetical protein
MLPVLGSEVIERKQRIAIRGRNATVVSYLTPSGFDEDVECCRRVRLGLGHTCKFPRAPAGSSVADSLAAY